MKKFVFLAIILIRNMAAADDLMKKAQGLFKPVPNKPPPLKDNPITIDNIEREFMN